MGGLSNLTIMFLQFLKTPRCVDVFNCIYPTTGWPMKVFSEEIIFSITSAAKFWRTISSYNGSQGVSYAIYKLYWPLALNILIWSAAIFIMLKLISKFKNRIRTQSV